MKVYLDIAHGNVDRHAELTHHHQRVVAWLNAQHTSYGLPSTVAELDEIQRETLQGLYEDTNVCCRMLSVDRYIWNRYGGRIRWWYSYTMWSSEQPGQICIIDPPESLVVGRLIFELSDQPSTCYFIPTNPRFTISWLDRFNHPSSLTAFKTPRCLTTYHHHHDHLHLDLAKQVENFLLLSTGQSRTTQGKELNKKKFHYVGTPIHRFVPGFVLQGGDVTRKDGSGGESVCELDWVSFGATSFVTVNVKNWCWGVVHRWIQLDWSETTAFESFLWITIDGSIRII